MFSTSTVEWYSASGSRNSLSTHKLMLFSDNREIYIRYMGNLAEDALVDIYPEFSNPSSKDGKMMAYYLVPWHCGLENDYCLTASKANFDAVKSGAKVWRDVDVNVRIPSLNFGVRAGDAEDYQWVEEQMFDAIENDGDFEVFATALRRVSKLVFLGFSFTKVL